MCSEKQCSPHVLGRCHPYGACPATNRRDQKPRRRVCSEEQCRPHVVGRCRPWDVPGDHREGPLPSHCCCGRRCRRVGDTSIEKPPENEQGLWARWKAKAKSLRNKHRRYWRNAATIASQTLDDAICKVIRSRWGHRVPPAGLPIEQVLGEYSLCLPS